MNDLVIGAWVGGAACYAGVLSAPPRLPLATIVFWAILWPVSICLAHREMGRPR